MYFLIAIIGLLCMVIAVGSLVTMIYPGVSTWMLRWIKPNWRMSRKEAVYFFLIFFGLFILMLVITPEMPKL